MSIRNNNCVNVFIPCCMDMFSPLIPPSVMTILEQLGDTCIYNEESTCCGRQLHQEGAIECAQQLAKKLINEYNSKYLTVIPSSACAGYIKTHFKELLENVVVPAELKNFTNNIYELCDYIVNVKGVTTLNNTFNHRVFYFKSCSARNVYKLQDEAEILLKNTNRLELLQSDKTFDCCTANSRFSFHNPEISDAILEDIVRTIYELGAQYITSTDIHCLQQIDAFIQANSQYNIEVIHIADILAHQE